MLTPTQAELVLQVVDRLERAEIVEQLRRCPARFPIDLTDEWLATQPVEELRHVFAAVCIQCGIIPSAKPPVRAA